MAEAQKTPSKISADVTHAALLMRMAKVVDSKEYRSAEFVIGEALHGVIKAMEKDLSSGLPTMTALLRRISSLQAPVLAVITRQITKGLPESLLEGSPMEEIHLRFMDAILEITYKQIKKETRAAYIESAKIQGM